MMGVVEGVEFVEKRGAGMGLGMGAFNQLMVWEEAGWGIWEEGEGACRMLKDVYLEWQGERRERRALEGKGKGKEKEV